MAVNYEIITMLCWISAGQVAWSVGIQGASL